MITGVILFQKILQNNHYIHLKGKFIQKMKIEEFSKDDFNYANNSIRIISGLYGILKPSV